jgi:hypothetical protein
VTAIAYDNPIPGFGTRNCNNLRLWAAKPSKEFDLEAFNTGDYVQAILAKQRAETLSSVLYPDDRWGGAAAAASTGRQGPRLACWVCWRGCIVSAGAAAPLAVLSVSDRRWRWRFWVASEGLPADGSRCSGVAGVPHSSTLPARCTRASGISGLWTQASGKVLATTQ